MTGHGLALPSARARRRKLPRPPKFTRADKLWLLWETLIGAYFLIHFLAGDTPLACLFAIAGATERDPRDVPVRPTATRSVPREHRIRRAVPRGRRSPPARLARVVVGIPW